ncbi:MAG: hypothetical protein GKR97_09840 [Rhizobiaceae bacterium]|nr:hypothetical protein [Rhizobiaceae bacterium]
MFRTENVETDFETAHELSDFSGLSPFDLVVFRPERLIVHGLLIRVTITLSVPDGPDYEELGINLRSMVARLYEGYVEPELDGLRVIFETVRADAREEIQRQLSLLHRSGTKSSRPSKQGIVGRIFAGIAGAKPDKALTFEQRLAAMGSDVQHSETEFEKICRKSLLIVVNSIIGHRGRLVGDDATIVQMATGLVLNDWASLKLGEAVAPLFELGARAEGYRFLPSQEKPFIMNVKGASAAGKSTIRPKQRALAERLGIAWEDFALVSPDYWRKYLLDYESLGEHHKYGAMLTGHELALIDRKLDRQMARRAEAGTIPHLLIDRFRFDSFSVGDDQSSQLLTRFGDTVFMFYVITPPEATVERAYHRGLSTGRYKAVDDLLDHNIEAYTGMPALFLSWASSAKKVHHEFLDNSVKQGELPRTVAFGWNDGLTILDVSKLLDIERYKKIDVEAAGPEQVYLETAEQAEDNLQFLLQCARSMPELRFADQQSGRLYGVMTDGEWVMRDADYVRSAEFDDDILAGLKALGWQASNLGNIPDPADHLHPGASDCSTLGSWGTIADTT